MKSPEALKYPCIIVKSQIIEKKMISILEGTLFVDLCSSLEIFVRINCETSFYVDNPTVFVKMCISLLRLIWVLHPGWGTAPGVVSTRVTHSEVTARGWMDLRSGNQLSCISNPPEALSC